MKKEREAIRGSMLFQEVFGLMCEGNIGCMTMIMNVFATLDKRYVSNPDIADQKKFQLLMDLDDMNMRGEQIYVLWKYVCDYEVDKFLEVITNRDRASVDAVNHEMTRFGPDFAWTAVTRGGSTSLRPFYTRPDIRKIPEQEVASEV